MTRNSVYCQFLNPELFLNGSNGPSWKHVDVFEKGGPIQTQGVEAANGAGKRDRLNAECKGKSSFKRLAVTRVLDGGKIIL
jgi:hypothetical protein